MTEKAEHNDKLRQQMSYLSSPDQLVVTRGIFSLPPDEVFRILQIVKEFDHFTEDNDPWGEHDFGSFECQGRKIFWEIDDYVHRLVLTVMFVEEY